MTKRTPVSALQNIWFDSQQVDNTDLTLEQNYNNTIDSSIINNQVGTGVLPEALIQNVIFDSSLASGFLDGIAIAPQNQPTDNNLGNQLVISLTNSQVAGLKTIKICIIGLDFQSNLQYETFSFRENEFQVTRKHFAKVLVLLFNDLNGNPNLSFNLGGRVVITEAPPMTLSRAPLMVAQDVQPNLFFRDFFIDSPQSLQAFLQSALPIYDVTTLNIFTTPADEIVLANGDVTTQIGEKFLAATNNIQKVTFLLSVRNLTVGQSSDLTWNGDLVASIYPLQSGVTCPTDIAPNTPIDFSPSNIPLAQISFNYTSLQTAGIVLDSVPQPVDFIFSNGPIASGTQLTPGAYYAVTLKRSGSANKCDILVAAGSALIPNSRLTTFTGSLWVDIPSEQLWFRVWTDAAKISDGQAYDSGHGIAITKTILDPLAQVTVDFSQENIQFTGNGIFNAVVSATTQESVPIPDQRTGNPILSRQQFTPTVSLLNGIDLANLENTAEPIVVGAITDKNIKFYDSISSLINSKLYSATMVKDEILIRIIDDPTDTARYDTSVISLQSNLLNGDFENAEIIPDATNPSLTYRIAEARLCSMILGDVNGDGIVDVQDLNLLNTFIGFDLTTGLPLHTLYNTDGYHATCTNGYLTLTQPFTNQFSIHFQLIDACANIIVDGYDGVLVANPSSPGLAQFTSASVLFSAIVGLSSYKLMIITPAVDADFGLFNIDSLDPNTDVLTLHKIILNGDTLAQMLRADIGGDFHISATDGYLLSSYIARVPSLPSPATTYPAPATNPYTKIGTKFNVIRLKIEKFVDRVDDYASNPDNRSTTVHPAPDVFASDGYLYSNNFVNSPIPLSIQKVLSWEPSLVVCNSNPKLVPTVFTSLTGFPTNTCQLPGGIQCNVYATQPSFDPGRVDCFVPDNLIIGVGDLQRPDGSFYKVDFEVGTIILEIPDGLFGSEKTINILDDFISDYTGGGITRLGFPAMRFADCSFVTSAALANDQLRFSVAMQSFSPNTNGLSQDGYGGIIVDGKMGVSIDYATGLLKLNFTNLYQDPVLQTLNTKVQIHVFLKKGGFNNQPILVNSTQVQNMLSLVSVFSGANDGGPSALVDLSADITGVLPIIHGGTGLNGLGAAGTVLVSTGSGLSYQFISALTGTIPFSQGIPSAGLIPETDGYGLLDPSFYYKNPIYISAVAFNSNLGASSIKTVISSGLGQNTIGSFTFRFDSFILEGLKSITLEAIVAASNPANPANVQLYNGTTATFVPLVGVANNMTTTVATGALVRSDDLKSRLSTGATDFLYFVDCGVTVNNGVDTATILMARLVLTYNNPATLSHSYNFGPNPTFPDLPS